MSRRAVWALVAALLAAVGAVASWAQPAQPFQPQRAPDCTVALCQYVPLARMSEPHTPTPTPTNTPTNTPTSTPTNTPTNTPTSTPTNTPPPAPIVVDITAIDWDPPGDDVVGERVVIINHGTGVVNMTSWTLKDLANNTYVFPAFTLAPGARVDVWTGPGTNNASNLYWGRGQAVWNNTGGDTAFLYDSFGVLRSQYSY